MKKNPPNTSRHRMRQKLLLVSWETEMSPPGVRVFSLATRTLAAEIEMARIPGWVVDVLDIPRGTTIERAASMILELSPTAVGFSTYVWNYLKHYRLADALRRANKDVYIIFGGPQMFYDEGDLRALFQKHPAIDCVVQGEGERFLLQLLESPRHRWPVMGTVGRGEPLPALGRFPYPLYQRFPPPAALSYLDIELSRGCPRRCAYCCIPAYGREIRHRPLTHLEKEFPWGMAHNIRSYSYISAGLSYEKNMLLALLRTLRRHDPRGLCSHQGEIDVGRLTLGEIERLRGLDFWLGLGIQSTAVQTNRLMRRSFDRKDFERGLRRLKQMSLQPVLEIIVGLPGDRLTDFLDTLEYSLSTDLPLVVFLFLVLPGTEFYQRRKELGIRYDARRAHRVLSTSTMSAEDIERALAAVRDCAGRFPDRESWIMLISDRGAQYVIPKKRLPPGESGGDNKQLDENFITHVRERLPPVWRRLVMRKESGYLIVELSAGGGKLKIGFSPAGEKESRFAGNGVVDISYLLGPNEADPLQNEKLRRQFFRLLESFGIEAR